MKRWKYLIVPLLVLSLTAIASACPMCKDSIPNSDAQAAGSLPSGFNDSVYLMLFTFLTTLGIMIGIVVKGVRSTSVAVRGFPVNLPKLPPNDLT